MIMPLVVSHADQAPLAAQANPLAQNVVPDDSARRGVSRCAMNAPLEPSLPALASHLVSYAEQEHFPRKEQPSAQPAMLARALQKVQVFAPIAHLVALLHRLALCVWFVLKAKTTLPREPPHALTVLEERFPLPS